MLCKSEMCAIYCTNKQIFMLGTQLYLLPKGKRFAIHPTLRYMVIGHGKAQALKKNILSERKKIGLQLNGVLKNTLL